MGSTITEKEDTGYEVQSWRPALGRLREQDGFLSCFFQILARQGSISFQNTEYSAGVSGSHPTLCNSSFLNGEAFSLILFCTYFFCFLPGKILIFLYVFCAYMWNHALIIEGHFQSLDIYLQLASQVIIYSLYYLKHIIYYILLIELKSYINFGEVCDLFPIAY